MKNSIQLLDCTLRDGAYIVNGQFGNQTLKGVTKKLANAHIDIIECGWLKDSDYQNGTSFFHTPKDIEDIINTHKKRSIFVAMIDYNRYNLENLPVCDGKTIDAIRIVFPRDKIDEGISLVEPIRAKGYKVYLQAANTLGYSDEELIYLANKVNWAEPEALSIVDTFGAMTFSDLQRIFLILNNNLNTKIKLGFHSHNNRQLSFALSMHFAENIMSTKERAGIIDSSLCGMGRGAGNTPTELLADYLNDACGNGYDMNEIMDVIDIYMGEFMKKYVWGYSIPYMLAGKYQCHVNNVEYLTKTHRSRSKDMKIIFDALTAEERRHYDYDRLETIYADYQSHDIDDRKALDELRNIIGERSITAVAPGNSSKEKCKDIQKYIADNNSIVIGINAVISGYKYDFLFFSNEVKYEIAIEQNEEMIRACKVILTSNIRNAHDYAAYIVNYNNLQKRKWKYYDNSMIMFLRLMCMTMPKSIGIAGFDGYDYYQNNYANEVLSSPLERDEIAALHTDVEEMFKDFVESKPKSILISFITPSTYVQE